MLSDKALLESVKTKSAFDIDLKVFDQLLSWQKRLELFRKIDFSDTGILLYLLQRKGISVASPGYAHGMVDEAQDLSEVELATFLHAVDEHQSVTICGDLDQKIKGEFDFSDADGFAGVVKRVYGSPANQKKTGATTIRLDTLSVGYRATRPIMELAWHVLGKVSTSKVAREGGAVQVLRTKNPQDSLKTVKAILDEHLQQHPNALVAVICKFKSDADQVFDGLKAIGCDQVRRHSRDDFVFTPGVIVTNADQVKGLEFSGCVVLNPSSRQYQDTIKDRMLLHVAFTRAADHLWIIGHEPMAYEIERFRNQETDDSVSLRLAAQ
jgi:DNA helicase IV